MTKFKPTIDYYIARALRLEEFDELTMTGGWEFEGHLYVLSSMATYAVAVHVRGSSQWYHMITPFGTGTPRSIITQAMHEHADSIALPYDEIVFLARNGPAAYVHKKLTEQAHA